MSKFQRKIKTPNTLLNSHLVARTGIWSPFAKDRAYVFNGNYCI